MRNGDVRFLLSGVLGVGGKGKDMGRRPRKEGLRILGMALSILSRAPCRDFTSVPSFTSPGARSTVPCSVGEVRRTPMTLPRG